MRTNTKKQETAKAVQQDICDMKAPWVKSSKRNIQTKGQRGNGAIRFMANFTPDGSPPKIID
eukprot:m.23889 g.23889  ORF g.23889 m.23889 type:complete len:62 (+) comp13261_c0_seq3:164-349(+)